MLTLSKKPEKVFTYYMNGPTVTLYTILEKQVHVQAIAFLVQLPAPRAHSCLAGAVVKCILTHASTASWFQTLSVV